MTYSNFYKAFISTILILLSFFLGLFLAENIFGFLDKGVKPSTEFPWYFIYADFRQFLSVSLFITIALILLFPFRKRLVPQMYTPLFAISFFVLPIIFKGVIIIMHCKNLFTPEIATTTWVTQNEYLGDIYNYWILIPASIIPLYFLRKKSVHEINLKAIKQN